MPLFGVDGRTYQGTDPRAERQRQKDTAKLAHAKALTFQQCYEGWFQGQEKGWSPKHTQQVRQIFRDYIAPVLGSLPVAVLIRVLSCRSSSGCG